MQDYQIHIGKKIKETLHDKGISATWLAQKINTHNTNMYKIFEKQYIDSKLLEAISVALDIDFFVYHSDYVNQKREKNRISQKR